MSATKCLNVYPLSQDMVQFLALDHQSPLHLLFSQVRRREKLCKAGIACISWLWNSRNLPLVLLMFEGHSLSVDDKAWHRLLDTLLHSNSPQTLNSNAWSILTFWKCSTFQICQQQHASAAGCELGCQPGWLGGCFISQDWEVLWPGNDEDNYVAATLANHWRAPSVFFYSHLSMGPVLFQKMNPSEEMKALFSLS